MRYIRKFIITSVVSAVMWVGCSSPSQEAEPVVKDCEAEYAEVCETLFTTTTAAIKRMDDYLADFGQENCAHVDDVKRMKELFEKMDLFFNNKQYDSYYEYLTKSQQVEEWFLNSGYRTVRATWLQLYEKDKQAMLENAIIDITAESFEENMKEDVERIVQEEVCGKGPLRWDITSVDIVRIEMPTRLSGLPGKQCKALFRVHISGPLGWRSGSVKVSLLSQLHYSASGTLEYRLVDYAITERSGSMPLFS